MLLPLVGRALATLLAIALFFVMLANIGTANPVAMLAMFGAMFFAGIAFAFDNAVTL
jgi:hypothetical protein